MSQFQLAYKSKDSSDDPRNVPREAFRYAHRICFTYKFQLCAVSQLPSRAVSHLWARRATSKGGSKLRALNYKPAFDDLRRCSRTQRELEDATGMQRAIDLMLSFGWSFLTE